MKKKTKLKGMWFKIKVPVPKNFSKVKDYRMFAQAFALLQVSKSLQNLKIAYFVLHTRKWRPYGLFSFFTELDRSPLFPVLLTVCKII